jgi:hypothetical protein
MKKVTLLLVVLTLGFTVSLFAQKTFSGNIKLKTYVEGTTDANILSQYQMEIDKTVLGSKSKQTMNQMGIGITTILDGDTKIMTMIVDFTISGYGKYYNTDTVDYSLMKYDYTYDANDTKTIAGYVCHKANCVATNLENDETEEFTLYVTDDLMNNYNSFEYPGLKGYPLYTSVVMDNSGSPFNLIVEVTEVLPNKKIKDFNFFLPDGAVKFEEAPAEVKQMLGITSDDEE